MSLAPLTIDRAIPHVCLVEDVLRILRLSRRTFERRMAERSLPLVELPRLGRQRRFTGQSVSACLRGRWADRRSA